MKQLASGESILLLSDRREEIHKMHTLMHHVHRAVLVATVLYVLRTEPVASFVRPVVDGVLALLNPVLDLLPADVRAAAQSALDAADAAISPTLTTLVGVTIVVGSLLILLRLERFYRVFLPNAARSLWSSLTGLGEPVELKARIVRLPAEELALILSMLVTLTATTLLVLLAQIFPSLSAYTSFFL